MSILMIFRIAFKALGRNKMRTALTMLGMIIGVGAVITMVALGTGAQSSIEAQIQSAGTNMIMVTAGNFTQGGVRQGQGNASTLVPEDAAAIAAGRRACSTSPPRSNTRGQIIAGNQNWNTPGAGHRRRPAAHPLLADDPRAASSRRRTSTTAAKVAVLGSTVRDQLFGPDVDPTGDHPHFRPGRCARRSTSRTSRSRSSA